MFSTLSKTEIIMFVTLELWSANAFNFDRSKILLCGNGLKSILFSLIFRCIIVYPFFYLWFSDLSTEGFNSEADLLNKYNAETGNFLWAGIIFNSDMTGITLPASLEFKLRVAYRTGQEDDDQWRTENSYPFFSTFGYRNNDSTGGEPCKLSFHHLTDWKSTLQYPWDITWDRALPDIFRSWNNIPRIFSEHLWIFWGLGSHFMTQLASYVTSLLIQIYIHIHVDLLLNFCLSVLEIKTQQIRHWQINRMWAQC